MRVRSLVLASFLAGATLLPAQAAPHVNELTTAIGSKDLPAVLRLIGEGCDVNGKDVRGDTPLIVAARVGAEEIVAELLSADADPLLFGKNRETAVGAAAASGDLRTLSLLIEAVEEPKQLLNEALFTAATRGDLDIARAMLAAGADPGLPPARSAPLEAAARSGVIEMIELLLDHGANPDYSEGPGNFALDSAILFGRVHVMTALLRRGANPNAGDLERGTPPLARAVTVGNPECVRVLVAFGADVERVGSDGSAILHLAASGRHPSMIGLLASLGADVNARDAEGRTPLLAAVEAGRSDSVRALIAAEADSSIPDAEGVTPLELARFKRRADLIELLD